MSNSVANAKAMEVFPDLHHKMSKKIAQLTKVIYHLNTKNEDHSLELEVMTSNHQMEIQNILRDAANRINKFKEMVENRQQALNQEAKVEKLVKKHEQEKAQAMQELKDIRNKMAEKEQKVAGEYQTKLEGMRKEIESMNKKFQDKIQLFESTNQELRKSLEDASKSGSMGLEELKRKYDAEIAELVRTSNDKYNAMLVEQLGIQEQLRKDLEGKMSLELKLQHERLSGDFEKELGQTRAKLAAEKQELQISLRHEHEQKMAEQKADFSQKMEKLLADLKSKSDAFDQLKTTSESTIKALEDKIRLLQDNLKEQVGGSQSRLNELTEEMGKLQDQNRKLQAKVLQREEEIETMQAMLTDKSGVLAKMEQTCKQLEQEVALLKQALEHAKHASSSNESELMKRLATSENQTASLRDEINQMAMNLMNTREELKKAEKGLQKVTEESDAKINKLSHELDAAHKTIKELEQRLSGVNLNATAEMESMRQRMKETEASYEQKILGLQTESAATLERERQRHGHEIKELTENLRKQSEAWAAKEQDLLGQLRDARKLHEDQTNALQLAHMQKIEELTAKHTQEVNSLKSALSELELQLQAVSESNETEKQQLRNDMAKLDSKFKALQKEFETKKKESERAESITNGLKTQIENLREELKASQKAFREKMDMSVAKLEEEWISKLEAEVKRLEEEKKAALDALAAQFAIEKANLIASHEEEVASLKLLLQKEAGEYRVQLVGAEKEKEALEMQLKQEKQQRAQQVADLTEYYSSQIRSLEENHKAELDRIKREHRSMLEQKEANLSQSHAMEIERLTRQLADQKADFEANMHSTLDRLQRELKEAVHKASLETENRLRQEMQAALTRQSDNFALEKQALLALHSQDKDRWEAAKLELERTVGGLRDELKSMGGVLDTERKERSRREENYLLEKDAMLRTHQDDLRRERGEFEKRVLEVVQRSERDMKALEREHVEVRNEYEDKLRQADREYSLLEERWRKRESRPEDLKRIEDLEREIVDKEGELQGIREEVVILKRTMLNREETYNQKFGRNVNVGVMNVLKDNASGSAGAAGGGNASAPSGGSQKAKPTQMRVINAQTGATLMPGIGGMGGVGGVGGMGVGGNMGMNVGGAPGSGMSGKGGSNRSGSK